MKRVPILFNCQINVLFFHSLRGDGINIINVSPIFAVLCSVQPAHQRRLYAPHLLPPKTSVSKNRLPKWAINFPEPANIQHIYRFTPKVETLLLASMHCFNLWYYIQTSTRVNMPISIYLSSNHINFCVDIISKNQSSIFPGLGLASVLQIFFDFLL